jgi:hypothetical protein
VSEQSKQPACLVAEKFFMQNLRGNNEKRNGIIKNYG